MSKVLPWLEYRWDFSFPIGLFPAILERLRGTPARLEEALRDVEGGILTRRPDGKWSAQEHAGHLLSVERLWRTRLEEYRRGASRLTAADMGNRATASADYNALMLDEILSGFRSSRSVLLLVLDGLDLEQASRVAHHPRLDRPMRLADLCHFAAEHDDHHLAVIHELLA